MKTSTRVILICAGIFAAAALASAQSKSTGTSSGTSSNGSSSRSTLPSSANTSNSTSNNTSTTGSTVVPHTLFISGKVTLTDGTPPPLSTILERACGGGPRTVGYTDAKGNFNFQLGQNPDVISDASLNRAQGVAGEPGTSSGGVRPQDLMGCELRASLPGFRSSAIDLSDQRYLDNPDVGIIVLERLKNVEGLTISATSALAPKDAQKAFNKGVEAAKKGNPDEAQRDFQKAVEIYPKYAYAWYELGRVYEQRDHFDDARHAYTQAIVADSKYVTPYERMYMMAVHDTKWDDVARITDQVLHLNPYDFPGAYYFNAVAKMYLGDLESAEKSAREAVKIDAGRNPRAGYILGLVLARKGEFVAATEYLSAYLKTLPEGKDADVVRKQLADAQQRAQAKAAAPDAPKPDK